VLNEPAQNEWWRVATELHRRGLLTVVDLHPLAAYCQAYGRWFLAERALAAMAKKDLGGTGAMTVESRSHAGVMRVIENPLLRVAERASQDMVKYAAQFGLTPASRSRIVAPAGGGERKSKFAGLLAS
jgi:P27 family predicted phage terminase small subunit